MFADKFPPPPYMEPGSKGKAVNPVLKFLDDWAQRNKKGPTGIKLDDEYGPTGVRWMKEYQKAHGLDTDGGCGPKTRAQMKKDGFDFNKELSQTGESITMFAQPGGHSALYWGPGISYTDERGSAETYMRRAYHGN